METLLHPSDEPGQTYKSVSKYSDDSEDDQVADCVRDEDFPDGI